jgi:hypothetical protein
MKILQVKRTPIYDVFIGDGWHSWTRILLRNSIVKVLSGLPLSRSDQQTLTENLNVSPK